MASPRVESVVQVLRARGAFGALEGLQEWEVFCADSLKDFLKDPPSEAIEKFSDWCDKWSEDSDISDGGHKSPTDQQQEALATHLPARLVPLFKEWLLNHSSPW